jgi:tRNA G18 (ribose-2'-O)-methylase SpoU
MEVRSLDSELSLDQYDSLPKNPIYIILDNLRSAFNVGSIFRLSDALRVKGLFLCGYTAFPPHIKLEKTSMGTINFVPWKHFSTTSDAVLYLKNMNIPVWAAETTNRSEQLYNVTFPHELGIVFGNEALGVSKEILDLCDNVIEIPLFGFKNSINVATSCSVIGFRAIEMMNKGVTKQTPLEIS